MLRVSLRSGLRFCRSFQCLVPFPLTSSSSRHQASRTPARTVFTAANMTSSATEAAELQQEQKKIIRGVVWDMDGTLTIPVIDFQYMRQRAGVGPTGDILDIISKWPPTEQQRAYAAIAEVEEQALRDMQAMPGLLDVCSFLDNKAIPRGLITRNVLRSVEFFHEHHLPLPPFVPAISRECQFPYKPSPAALLHIADVWGIKPSEVIMIGDSAKDDVVCGNRAGAITVLLDTEGRYTKPGELQGECKPTAVVTSLLEFKQLLQTSFDLLPPEGLQQQLK